MRLIIFGAGNFAYKLFDEYSILDLSNVLFFVDNNKEKWGTSFLNKEIKDPKKLIGESLDNCVILVASSYYEDISQQLKNIGFEENEHFFDAKALLYYRNQQEKNKQVYNEYCRNIKSIQWLSNINITRYKKSNTLFILGSGKSINEYTGKQWGLINNHDSVGFNNWILHDFIPTCYLFELPKRSMREYALKFYYNFNKRVPKDYKKTLVFMKDIMNNSQPDWVNYIDDIYIANDMEIYGEDSRKLRTNLLLLDKLKFFNIDSNKNYKYMFRKRATVAFNILLGMMMGYKEIILCGIDLNHNIYFYEDNFINTKEFQIPTNPNPTLTIHNTYNPNYPITSLTIDKVIYEINELLLKPRNIKLFVAKTSSALYPMLPSYFNEVQ